MNTCDGDERKEENQENLQTYHWRDVADGGK